MSPAADRYLSTGPREKVGDRNDSGVCPVDAIDASRASLRAIDVNLFFQRFEAVGLGQFL